VKLLQEDERSDRGHGALSGGGDLGAHNNQVTRSIDRYHQMATRMARATAQAATVAAVSASIRAAKSARLISPTSPSAWERTATPPFSCSRSPTTSMYG
jgi:hypothetical protein